MSDEKRKLTRRDLIRLGWSSAVATLVLPMSKLFSGCVDDPDYSDWSNYYSDYGYSDYSYSDHSYSDYGYSDWSNWSDVYSDWDNWSDSYSDWINWSDSYSDDD